MKQRSTLTIQLVSLVLMTDACAPQMQESDSSMKQVADTGTIDSNEIFVEFITAGVDRRFMDVQWENVPSGCSAHRTTEEDADHAARGYCTAAGEYVEYQENDVKTVTEIGLLCSQKAADELGDEYRERYAANQAWEDYGEGTARLTAEQRQQRAELRTEYLNSLEDLPHITYTYYYPTGSQTESASRSCDVYSYDRNLVDIYSADSLWSCFIDSLDGYCDEVVQPESMLQQ